jgi:hypothetical protein
MLDRPHLGSAVRTIHGCFPGPHGGPYSTLCATRARTALAKRNPPIVLIPVPLIEKGKRIERPWPQASARLTNLYGSPGLGGLQSRSE